MSLQVNEEKKISMKTKTSDQKISIKNFKMWKLLCT